MRTSSNHRHEVGVVMIVRNGATLLAGAVESVLAQTRPVDEIIVVDGASSDETIAVADRYAVRVVQQPGTGIADARNHGIAETSRSLIAFLDHDDRWMPSKTQRQVECLQANETLGYSVTLVRAARAAGIAVAPVLEVQIRRGPYKGLTPSSLVVRRSTMDVVGPFDVSLGIGCDSDWFARAIDCGIDEAFVDEVLVEKLLHDRNASIDVAATGQDLMSTLRASVRRKRSAQNSRLG